MACVGYPVKWRVGEEMQMTMKNRVENCGVTKKGTIEIETGNFIAQ